MKDLFFIQYCILVLSLSLSVYLFLSPVTLCTWAIQLLITAVWIALDWNIGGEDVDSCKEETDERF